MMYLAVAQCIFIACVQGITIHHHEETNRTPLSAVKDAAAKRQNGTLFMSEGLSSLVNLLHKESKEIANEFHLHEVSHNDSQLTVPYSALIDSSGVHQKKHNMISGGNNHTEVELVLFKSGVTFNDSDHSFSFNNSLNLKQDATAS